MAIHKQEQMGGKLTVSQHHCHYAIFQLWSTFHWHFYFYSLLWAVDVGQKYNCSWIRIKRRTKMVFWKNVRLCSPCLLVWLTKILGQKRLNFGSLSPPAPYSKMDRLSVSKKWPKYGPHFHVRIQQENTLRFLPLVIGWYHEFSFNHGP